MYPFERVKRSYHFFIANPPLSFTVCNVKLALLQCLYIHTRAHDPLTRLFSVSPFGTENKWRGETRVLNKTVGLDTERMAKLNFYRLLSRSHLPLPLSIPPFLIQFYQLYIYIYFETIQVKIVLLFKIIIVQNLLSYTKNYYLKFLHRIYQSDLFSHVSI